MCVVAFNKVCDLLMEDRGHLSGIDADGVAGNIYFKGLASEVKVLYVLHDPMVVWNHVTRMRVSG